jgi:hypothetical protein
MPVRLRIALPVAVASAVLALGLAGCTPTPSPTTSGSRSASDPATSVPSAHDPTTTAVPSPTASATGSPVGRTCAQLISNNAIYAYNPNFVPITSFTPSAGSSAAQAVAYKGVACRWQNETSNDVIDLSVANLDAATIESLKNQSVAKSTLVPTYQGADEGYFSAGNGVGTAIVFVRSYWVVMTSQQFAEPGDAEQLVDGVIAALP